MTMTDADRTIRLLVSRKPHSDESLMGYILRLTELNNYDTCSWILKRAGFNSSLVSVSCSFAFNDKAQLKGLAQLTNSSPEELAPLFCPPAKKHGIFIQSIFGKPVPKRMIRLKRQKLCPECLHISTYHRRIWDLSPVTACPLHRCLLLDECPNCMKRISWVRKNVSICRCGYDWRLATSALVEDAELLLIRQIYQHCRLHSGNSECEFSKNNQIGRAHV